MDIETPLFNTNRTGIIGSMASPPQTSPEAEKGRLDIPDIGVRVVDEKGANSALTSRITVAIGRTACRKAFGVVFYLIWPTTTHCSIIPLFRVLSYRHSRAYELFQVN